MHLGNAVVVIVGVAALILAARIAWQGRALPALAPRTLPTSVGASALDALRTLAALAGAAVVAGVLVAGLGGRLYMRVMAATSGNDAQGRLTEAEEVVGEVTFGGTLGFVLFIGIVLPVAASFGYLALRHYLPGRAATAGLGFGVILLAVFGTDDPMSPENVDFEILSPLWLAIVGIVGLGLLYGATFGALAGRFDAGMRPLSAGLRTVPSHASLLLAVLPPFVVVTVPYVALRGILRGRTAPWVDRGVLHTVGVVLVGVGIAVAAVVTVITAIDIL